MNCFDCIHKKNSILKDLSNEDLRILEKSRYGVSYKLGDVICKEGIKPSGLICLNKGKVKIVRRVINGNEQITGLIKAIDYIAFRALMGGTSCSSSYVCLEDSSVCIIKKRDFFKVINKNNKLAFEIIKRFAKDLIKKDIRMTNLAQKHVRARMAEALLLIYDVFGINHETGFLNTSMKRSELADLANMTTDNAIREISSLKKDKLIEVDHRKIRLIDLNILKSISDFDL